MPYRGQLIVDFTGAATYPYQQMQAALTNLGWTYVETSAFVYDQPSGVSDAAALVSIWQGIATLARATSAIGGVLSAVTYTIQFVDPAKISQTAFGSSKNPLVAYTAISVVPFPGDAAAGN